MNDNVEVVRLTMPQLAARLGASAWTIRRWYRKGLFPRPHYIAGRRVWKLSEVREWEEKHVRAQFEGMTP